jgi:hypothetical protein
MQRCGLALFRRPSVVLELDPDSRVFQVTRITPTAHVSEKRGPKVWSPKTLVELVAMAVQAQGVRGGRRPPIRFCVVLGVIFDWSFGIATDAAGAGGRCYFASGDEALGGPYVPGSLPRGVTVVPPPIHGLLKLLI